MRTLPQPHILIAEDEQRLQSSLQFLFHRKGYQVTSANTGTEALEIIRMCRSQGTPIDLMITDIQMPGIGGESLIRAVREFDGDLPILVMTAFGSKDLVVRLMRLECNDYIDKPFGMEQIEAQVDSILAQARGDVAERNKIAQLRSAGEMARSIGHDMKNMMHAAIGQTGLAMRELDDSHPAKKRLSKVLASTTVAADLAQQLFRSKKDVASIITRPVELRAFIEQTASVLRSYAPETIVVRTIAPDDPIWFIFGTEHMLQALMNLGENAIAAMANEGTVTFKTTLEEKRRAIDGSLSKFACITVSDTGPGFSPLQLSMIFKEGFTTKAQGHGYGLLSVKSVVDEYKGRIEVRNCEKGGAEFKLYFPLEITETV